MTPAALDRLKAGARSILGHELPDNATQQFFKYLELLIKWQNRHRLAGSTDARWVVENLFLDSLLFFRVLPREAKEIIDIGSGAGFPGYPLKIAYPEIRLTLIDGRQTRASFLRTVARDLLLEGVTVLNERAEVAAESLGRSFDAAVMRCVATPARAVPLAEKFIRTSGVVIVASQPSSQQQLPLGRRVVVEGIDAGSTRAFTVYGPLP